MSDIHHAAERQLFDETLSCELALPVEFRAGATPPRPGAAEALLRGLAQVEDSRAEDGLDERGELPQAVQRVEAKLDLVLGLLGRLVRQSQPALPLRQVRWSRQGMRLETDAPAGLAAGTTGTLVLQPGEWLPEAVELPARVLAEASSGTGGSFLWLRFEALAPGLEAALERHLFRLHRRQVAEARRAAPGAG